jgi:hypothetical protein
MTIMLSTTRMSPKYTLIQMTMSAKVGWKIKFKLIISVYGIIALNWVNITDRIIEKKKVEKEPFKAAWHAIVQKEKTKEMEMKTVIKEMLVYFTYLGIIMLISYGSRDSDSYRQKTAIEKALIYGGMNCDILPDGACCLYLSRFGTH